jgi:hypothetical protein
MKRIWWLKRCMRSLLPSTHSASSLSTTSARQISQMSALSVMSISLSTSSGVYEVLHCGQM